jgi:ribosome-binding factor A
MQTTRRTQRLALQMQQEISMMLFKGIKDPRIGLVTITGVDLSPDLRHAKVYFSALGNEQRKKESLEALNHAAGWIRRELGQRIRMKYSPEIVFRVDTSQEYGEHIDQLLDEIKEN